MKPDMLVDTDVLVDFLRGNEHAVAFVLENAAGIALSSITVAELYAGSREEELSMLSNFIRLFPVIPITADIAQAGGLLKARYAKSHGVGLADALLAATAQQHSLVMQTLNTKHFPMFPGADPPYRK